MSAHVRREADTTMSRCRFYRQVCGLVAVVQPDIGRIVVPSGSVGAITMPAQLGAQVRLHMNARRVRLGPIISHPRSKRWTYLIIPDIPDEVRLFAELFRHNASVARVGAQIALPSPTDGYTGYRVWVQPPRDQFRPSGMLIVEAVRACAGKHR